jgi:hypothetical protein
VFRSHPLQSTDPPHGLTFRKGDSALLATGRRIVPAYVLSTLLPVAFGQVALTMAQVAKRVSPSVVVIQGKTDSSDVLGGGSMRIGQNRMNTSLGRRMEVGL